MKKNLILLAIGSLFLLQGCQKESVYTLSQTEVSIEVHTKDFDPLAYLRKDGEVLSDKDKEEIKTGTDIDVSNLGEAVFKFPEFQLELNVKIIDSQSPTLNLLGFQIEKDKVFTWNEENLAKLKPQVKDNYDDTNLLKKSLQCDSVDSSVLGNQTIQCSVEDTSGNKTISEVTIEVIK